MNEIRMWLSSVLPCDILAELESYTKGNGRNAEEIRLRAGRKSEYVIGGTSYIGSSVKNADEVEDIFFKICHGSVYAYADSICRGYVKPVAGVRVGVCGSADVRDGVVRAVYGISSINIRLPCPFFPDVREISDRFLSLRGGMLVYSPPGVGKTTYLRSLAKDLSGRCGIRVSLIDTRGELSSGLDEKELMLDILDGYPRGEGIRIAVRTMTPNVIICDEIGSAEESDALLEAVNCGASFVASAHGDDAEGVICRRFIRVLHDAGLFGIYVGLSREHGEKCCRVKIQAREEIGNGV